MKLIPYISILLAFASVQVNGQCSKPLSDKIMDEYDLVAIASTNEEEILGDFFLNAHQVFKGRVPNGILINSPDFVFEKGVRYLVFAKDTVNSRFFVGNPNVECFLTTKLSDVTNETNEFLQERWISQCYSKALEDSMTGSMTRELQPFCGCDGKTYENFGHLLSKGITQYRPGECEKNEQ
ncbi:MAG: hypothetical protein AAFO69_08490 [Bacteroidota bacterium]